MSKIKLLPCPFCGHPASSHLYKDRVHVECSNYECAVAPFVIADSEEEAAAKWNTRTKPIKLVRSRVSEKRKPRGQLNTEPTRHTKMFTVVLYHIGKDLSR